MVLLMAFFCVTEDTIVEHIYLHQSSSQRMQEKFSTEIKIEISRILGCPSWTKSMLGGDFKGVDYGRKSVFGFPE